MSEDKLSLSRRSALKLIAVSAVTIPAADALAETSHNGSKDYSATDPDLLNPSVEWEMLLNQEELEVLVDLCDLIIPADTVSPSASSLGAQNYINEYVSAPYPQSQDALKLVREGIAWLQNESAKRFEQVFPALIDKQKHDICNDIKWLQAAKPKHQLGARFFAIVRDLTATAFYTTNEGMADVGYIGNRPSQTFEGPSKELLKMLELES